MSAATASALLCPGVPVPLAVRIAVWGCVVMFAGLAGYHFAQAAIEVARGIRSAAARIRNALSRLKEAR